MHTKSRSEFLRNPLFITISPVTYDIASTKNTECRAHIRMGLGWFNKALAANTYLQVTGNPVTGLMFGFTDVQPETKRKGWYQLRHYEPYVTTTVTLPRGEVPADEMEMDAIQLDDYNISLKYKGTFRPHLIKPPKPVKTGPAMRVPGAQTELWMGEQKLSPMDLGAIETHLKHYKETPIPADQPSVTITEVKPSSHLISSLRTFIGAVNELVNTAPHVTLYVENNVLKARIDI